MATAETTRTEHKFEAEVEQVLRLVIHSLYSKREIFLRELLSNASDALDKRRFEALTDPARGGDDLGVDLRIDAEAKTLTVADDGVGMSREELIENLGTVARSGSKALMEKLAEDPEAGSDLQLIGQFGVGFYSAWLVADQVDVVSRRAGSAEAHRWSSKAQSSFTVEAAERESVGTTITLHLREESEEFLQPYRLKQLVERYSDYLSWPIRLHTTKTVEKDDGEEVEEPQVEALNRGTALWQRPRSEIDDEAATDLYRHLARDWDGPRAWRHFRIEGMREASGFVFLPKHRGFDLYHPDATHGMRLYVKRVFILDEAEDLLPRWLRFVKGVVDSEDLPLNVSRELLQDSKVVAFLRKQVVKQTLALLSELADEKPAEYREFWASFGAVLKEGIHLDPSQRGALVPLLRFHSSTQSELTTLAAYRERMKEGQEGIYYVLADSLKQAEGSPHIEGLVKQGFEVLYLVDPIDQFMVDGLGEVDGAKLLSATAADVGTGEAVEEEQEAALDELRSRFRKVLQDHVSEVKLSRRMVDSAVSLVLPPGGLPPHLERLMRATQPGVPAQKRILEVNPDHAVVKNLQRLLDTDRGEQVDEWIQLLHDQALVAEGSPLEDPAAFSRRLTALLTTASRDAAGVTADEAE
jgi:molecular chaperone HtpG